MIITKNLEKAIPDEMKTRKNWVVWKYGKLREGGKKAKEPYTPEGKKAKVNDPDTWSTWPQVCDVSGYEGVGFVFSGDYIGIDLDSCVSEGKIEPWARKIIDHVSSYTEISPSGKGVHILLKGELPQKGKRRKGKIECYDRGRYFTMTGKHLQGTPNTINSYDGDLLFLLFPLPEIDENKMPWLGCVFPEVLSDGQLIERACRIPKFRKLWSGDISNYSSHSEADLALCQSLAFWTQKDENRIKRLFEISGLYREKWSKHPTYASQTIAKALSTCSNVYSPPAPKQEKEKVINTGGCVSPWGFETYSASHIWDMPLKPLVWIVEGLLPEGLTILSGPPKIGKSFLCLNIGLGLAEGGVVLGQIKVEKADSIYFALEDNTRRIQDRLNLMRTERPPDGLKIATLNSLKILDDGGLEQIEIYLDHHPQTKLIIIDTFIKVKPRTRNRGANQYDIDSQILTPLHNLALSKQIGILLIFHNTKAKADDFINSPSGSMANTGTADTAMVLSRGRVTNQGKLQITGRDVIERCLALEYHEDFGSWQVIGDYKMSNISPQRKEIIDLLKNNGFMRGKPIADTLNKNFNNIKVLLGKMVKSGEIKRDMVRGYYI